MSLDSRSARVLIAVGFATAAVTGLILLGGGVVHSGNLALAQYEPPAVVICHHALRGGRIVHVTQRVRPAAVAGHRRHGDTLGACNTVRNRAAHAAPAHIRKYHVLKVTICHHARRASGVAHVTIQVPQSALRAHILHGDSVGRCGSARAKKVHGSAAHITKWHRR